MFNIIHCEPVRQALEKRICEDVKAFKARGVYPKLAVIRAGEDSGQIFYENAIVKSSEIYGIETQVISFANNASEAYLEVALQAVNSDEEVHGIIMLKPFPENIDDEKLREMLSPDKDVDAVTDMSIANTFIGKDDTFYSCTAEACIEVMKYYDIDPEGKKITIIGRSMTVGKPLAIMLINKNATVTVCHSMTAHEDLVSACQNADIVVLATGQTETYGSEYFRDGQIVLDVGTGTGRDGKMHGDLDIEEITASGKISELTYTPVPGGIGAVTTAILMRNITKSAGRR